MSYSHTQPARWMLIGLAVGALTAGTASLATREPVGLVPAGILGICALLFHSLRVDVDEVGVRIRFGPGLIRRSYPWERIHSARPVRTKWWHGWGIHRTPQGWLYNVEGLDAVEVELMDGKKVLIGTDEPERLATAIEAGLRSTESQRSTGEKKV